MAPQNDRLILPEDTFNQLRERAAKEGDTFNVKVWRRAHLGGSPDLIATLSGATVEHFSAPELWLPSLCGGGLLSLQGYHATDLSKPVGGFLQVSIKSQESKDVDDSVLRKPDWRGPPTLEYPQRAAPAQRAESMYNVGSPPAPGSGDNATRVQAWPRSAGGGSVHQEDYGTATSERAWQERQRLQGVIETERRKLEEERLANEREKHRQELESLKKSHDADMRAFKAEIMSEIRSKPTGPDPSATLMETMMRMQAENAKQASEDRREREKIAADDRRAAEARQAASEDRFNRMFEKLADRPKEDPLAMISKVTELMGKGNSNEAQMKMMHSMSEMMSSQVGVAMDFVQAAADMQLGGQPEKESPIIRGIEAAVKGIGAMARGAQKRPAPQQFAPAPQLPPTYEQQARAQPAPAGQPQPPPPPAPPKDTRTALEQIEGAIRVKYPIAQVAEALITHFQDPSIQTALMEAGGDVEALIQKRLGNWALENPDNKTYLDSLFAEVERRIEAAGLFGGGDDEEGEEASTDEGEENEE